MQSSDDSPPVTFSVEKTNLEHQPLNRSISKSEQATSSASPQRIFFAGLVFLAYHETLVLKTGESATVIIAHTGVTGAAAAVLSLATAEGGRLAMVAARYIEERYLNPLREKRIKREQEAMEKSRKEGSEQGREQGREQGSADANADMGSVERTAAGR